MANRYSIETTFRLIDQITAPLNNVGKAGTVVGRRLKRDFMAAEDSVAAFGNKLKTIGKLAIGAGIAAVSAGVVVATRQFIEFDNAATAASAKFKDLDVTSNTYAASLEEIKNKAREVAAVTEYNAVDTAGALDKMAMAGLTSAQSMAMLMGTTNLATAAGLDLTSAVDIATDTMGAFRLMTDDAGNSLTESEIAQNMDRVADVFARTTNQFNTDMPGLFEAIKKGGPVFADAGQSIESFSALMGVMANSGIKGSEAGTQLRNIMLRLAGPTGEAASLMKSLGVDIKDSQGNYLDVIDIIGQFEKATKSMGSAERAAAMSTIFGSRSVTGMNILMAEGASKLNEYRDGLINAGGAAADIAAAMRNSIQNKIEVLKSALTELGFKFVEAFQTQGVGVIEKLTAAISTFDPTPIVNGVKMAADVIMGIAGVIWNLREIILGVAIAWGIYKAAMIAAVLIAPIMGMVQAVMALMAAQKGMNIVQAIFNVLLKANPVGLIITGIGILISLFILAYNRIEPFRNAVNGLLERFKAFGIHVMEMFTPAFEVLKIVWDKLMITFGEIGGYIGRVFSLFQNIFGIVGKGTGSFSLLDIILKRLSIGLQVIGSLFGGLVETVGALFGGINDIIDAFSNGGFLAGIKQIGISLLNFVLTPIKGILGALSHLPIVGDLAAAGLEKIEGFTAKLNEETVKNTSPLANVDATVISQVVPAPVSTASSGLPAGADRRRNRAITNAAIPPTRPMTTAEQITSIQRNEDSMEISVAPEPGAQARITRPPRGGIVRALNSGSNR